MGFTTKKIQNLFLQTGIGELSLSGKAGEDPEMKLFTDSIEDSDDSLTNDGQLIINGEKTRSYIQGVFAFSDDQMPFVQNNIQTTLLNGVGQPANIVTTDGKIYSGIGAFVGPIVYNGTGTVELKLVSANNFIQT